MKKSGFTLVEILIVVIILGILAAIVIPQFTSASESAKESNLKSDLLTLRNQLELYRVQHGDRYPWQLDDFDDTSLYIVTQLTSRTDDQGNIGDPTVDKKFKYGPYLERMPTNLFVQERGKPGDQFEVDGTEGSGDFGWFVNTTTGKVNANSDSVLFPDHWDF